MAETEITNGNAPTPEAKKLVQANYGDRAAAALPDARRFDHDILKLLGEYDPDHINIEDCRRMSSDLHIKMAMHFSKAPLISADYSFQCDDPRIAAAAKENYDQIHVPWMELALNSWNYGNQGAVKQFKYGRLETTYEDSDSGEVKPVWDESSGVDPVLMGVPIGLPHRLTEPKVEKGRFAGMYTSLARLGNADDHDKEQGLVPPEWSIWWAHLFNENYRNYFGKSRLIPVYPAWYSYWANWHNRDRHADTDADPALQVWYPSGESRVPNGDGTFRVVSNRDAALDVGRELRNGSTVAWPSDVFMDEQGRPTVTRKWTAEFLTGGDNLAAFTSLLDSLEVAKFRGCMVPEQTLIEAIQGSGARNVAATQADLFLMSLEIEAKTQDNIFNKYQLRPWVEANFGADAPSCTKTTTGFKSDDMTLATELITIAFNADPNALPIKFEKLLEDAGIAMYSKKEQEEREKAVAEAQQLQAEEAANAEVGTLPGEQPQAPPGSPDAAALNAAQEHRRRAPRLYDRPGRIDLSAHRRAPEWARQEGQRRDRNVEALAERLRDVVRARYEDVFEAAADAIASAPADLSLSADGDWVDLNLARRGGLIGRGGLASRLVDRVRDAVEEKVALYRGPLEDELASVYHASGAAELKRLGLSGETWDVGRQEVQDWARQRAGELIVTIDQTVVEKTVRPWLEQALADPAYEATFVERAQGIPIDSVELAAQLTDRFSSYPTWMAERVVRSEARSGYNESAADMWERVGVTQVDEFDGLGGKSGVSDEECIARNGRRVTVDEFRMDNRGEHPNGTLGGVPVTTTILLKPLKSAVLMADARRSRSAYAVTDEGLILGEAETGLLLAGS